MSLLAKDTIATDTGLERRAAAIAVRELLTAKASGTLKALRDELKATRLIALSAEELADLLSEVLP